MSSTLTWGSFEPQAVASAPAEAKARLDAVLTRAAGLGVTRDQLSSWSKETGHLFRKVANGDQQAAFLLAGKLSFIEAKVAELEEKIRVARAAARKAEREEVTAQGLAAGAVSGLIGLVIRLL
jgi:hypothetical protein